MPNLNRHPWLITQVPFLLVAGLADLVKLICRPEPTTIHAHWLIPQGFLAVVYRKIYRPRNLRIVITSHGGDLYGLPRLKWLMRWIMGNADLITVVNSSMVDEIRRIAPALNTPVEVISMGVDCDVFSPQRTDPNLRNRHGLGTGPLILFVGRLTQKKGLPYLIDAMPAVLAACPSAQLLIVGGGSEEEALRTQVASLGIGDAVVFAGIVEHVSLPAYFAGADVFVGPSITANDGDREGLPVTFAEAMASGCLTVVSRIDGIEDLVQDGETGFIVPSREPEAISQRIIQILKGSSRLGEMRYRARKHVQEKFDWNKITPRYLSALDGR